MLFPGHCNIVNLICIIVSCDIFFSCIESSIYARMPALLLGNRSNSRDIQNYIHQLVVAPAPVRHSIRRRSTQKKLGEKCFKFSECATFSLCIKGICSCPYEYYIYSSPQSETAICRKKVKYGYFCVLTDDCKAYDPNTFCSESLCRCVNGTHFIGSRNLLTYDRRCYKILEREGDRCDIDEQCSRLADNYHKCRCVGICDCTSVEHYGGCSICHENIKRTFFGGAAFIVILLTSRLFTKIRQQSSSTRQDRLTTATNNTGRRTGSQMLNSSTVPTVSTGGRGLRTNRRVASSLPNVFLIDRHNFNIPSSQTMHFLPQRDRNTDAPPSYDDIVESDQLVWSEPPPAYEEVALKYMQPRQP